MARMILGVLPGGLAGGAGAFTGLPTRFGAHPFWAEIVVMFGLAVAVVLLVPGYRRPRPALAVAAGLALPGAVAARWGKAEFKASFAENALAGRALHFGWIALCAGLITLIGTAIPTVSARLARC